MRKKEVIIGITLLLITAGLSGCIETNNSLQVEEYKLLGTWRNTSLYEDSIRTTTNIFLSDKTCELIASYKDETIRVTGIWKLRDNKIILFTESDIITRDYYFSNNNNTLSITVQLSGSCP